MAQEKFYLAPQRYSFPAKLPRSGAFGPREISFSREVGDVWWGWGSFVYLCREIMESMRNLVLWICMVCVCSNFTAQAQVRDTLFNAADSKVEGVAKAQKVPYGHEFKATQLIAPVALVGVGLIGNQIDAVKKFDFGLRGSQMSHHNGFVYEDVLQYVLVAALYGLKVVGVQSKHSYIDMTSLVVGSYCVMGASVLLLKKAAKVERPNGLDSKSFPSGHSARAFMGAELLRLEYKDVSPWIGYAGYAAATVTALARVGHWDHWVTDVVAGAGIGILSTKVAYWVAPHLQRALFGKWIERKGLNSKEFSFIGAPFYNGEHAGFALAMSF